MLYVKAKRRIQGVGELSVVVFFFFSSRRRHTRLQGDWSSDVCSSDLLYGYLYVAPAQATGQVSQAIASALGIILLALFAWRLRERTSGQRSAGREIGRASCRERV